MSAKNILGISLLCVLALVLATWTHKNNEAGSGDDPTGTYIMFVPTPSLTTQTIILHLERDVIQSAVMTTDDQNDAPPAVARGTWKHEGGGNILVMLGSDPKLLFSIEGNALELWHRPGEPELVLSRAILPLESQWRWVETRRSDAATLTPTIEKPFILRLGADGHLTATGDCNDISGTFSMREGARIVFGPLLSTKMFCEGSFESGFTDGLSSVESYTVRDDTLTLKLKNDEGLMEFDRHIRGT